MFPLPVLSFCRPLPVHRRESEYLIPWALGTVVGGGMGVEVWAVLSEAWQWHRAQPFLLLCSGFPGAVFKGE